MTDKEYINLLEEAVTVHANAPANPIVKWSGKGDLPVTMDAEDINYLVDKIVKGDGLTDTAIGSPSAKKSGVSVKEGETSKSPLSILEKELNEADDIDKNLDVKTDIKETDISEDLEFTNQESDILSRLINEMGELEANFTSQDDDLIDTDINTDDVIAPGDEYEIDDLDAY